MQNTPGLWTCENMKNMWIACLHVTSKYKHIKLISYLLDDVFSQKITGEYANWNSQLSDNVYKHQILFFASKEINCIKVREPGYIDCIL